MGEVSSRHPTSARSPDGAPPRAVLGVKVGAGGAGTADAISHGSGSSFMYGLAAGSLSLFRDVHVFPCWVHDRYEGDEEVAACLDEEDRAKVNQFDEVSHVRRVLAALADYLERKDRGDVGAEATARFLSASSLGSRRLDGPLSPVSVICVRSVGSTTANTPTGSRRVSSLRPHDLRHIFACALAQATTAHTTQRGQCSVQKQGAFLGAFGGGTPEEAVEKHEFR